MILVERCVLTLTNSWAIPHPNSWDNVKLEIGFSLHNYLHYSHMYQTQVFFLFFFSWFIYLYLIISWLRRYGIPISVSTEVIETPGLETQVLKQPVQAVIRSKLCWIPFYCSFIILLWLSSVIDRILFLWKVYFSLIQTAGFPIVLLLFPWLQLLLACCSSESIYSYFHMLGHLELQICAS